MEVIPGGMPGDEPLREGDQAGALGARLLDPPHRLLEAAITPEEGPGRLDDRDAQPPRAHGVGRAALSCRNSSIHLLSGRIPQGGTFL